MIKKEAICLALVLFIALFYLLTIRGGQPWPDDFAGYVHESENITKGIPLADTGYIYNPQNPDLGPQFYPPVFPLLLVPSYKVWDLDLTPMKVEIIACFVGLLLLLWRTLGAELSLPVRFGMLGAIGLNPFFWNFKDHVLSDIPFTLFLFVTFALSDQLLAPVRTVARGFLLTCATAVSMYLCYGTRSAGIVLVPAAIGLAFFHRKRHPAKILWAAALGLLLCLIQNWVLQGATGYMNEMKLLSAHVVLENVHIYLWSLATFFQNPYSKVIRDILFIVFLALGLAGYIRRLLTEPRLTELFVPLYVGVIVIFPGIGGLRYLIPIIPLYVFYAAWELERNRFFTTQRFSVALGAGVLIFASYVAQYSKMDYGAFREGVADRQATELFDYVKHHTAPTDVFVFRRPRAFALYTNRRTSGCPQEGTDAIMLEYINKIHANYVIKSSELDDPYFGTFVERESKRFSLEFRDGEFSVYRVL